MNRHLISALGLTLGLGAACSSGSDDRAPSLSDAGAPSVGGAGGRSPGGKGGKGGSSSTDGGGSGEAGSAGAAGAAGSVSGAGGEGGLEPGTIIPVTPGACSEAATWADATPLEGISSAADEQLLAITPDELDIVFLRDDVAMLAHRNQARAAFGAPVELAIPEGYSVDSGVALSADGKTLVLLDTAGQSFAEFTRTSRTEAFGLTGDATAFTALNQRAIQTMEHYAAPVLAPDGKTFVFAAFTPEPTTGFPTGFEGVSVVYESVWTTNGWAMPESISDKLFDGTSAARALPSGLSSDSRTLFYFDEGSGKQMARFRDRPDAPLYTVVELDGLNGAIPDVECDKLYYSRAGDVLVGAE